ncbi:MAG: hypothetical protein M0Q90_15830 [Bacteroidales bacterium]|nr:hypothetical protein [Bacteroidales bacterium]
MTEIRIRRIINSETITIKELREFLGKEVDIRVTTRRKVIRKKQIVDKKTAAAMLGKYKNIALINKESDVWDTVIKEKYANR